MSFPIVLVIAVAALIVSYLYEIWTLTFVLQKVDRVKASYFLFAKIFSISAVIFIVGYTIYSGKQFVVDTVEGRVKELKSSIIDDNFKMPNIFKEKE